MLRPCKIRQRAKPLSLGSSRALTSSCCVGDPLRLQIMDLPQTKDTLKLAKFLPEAFCRGGNTSPWPATLSDKLPWGVCCPARLSEADHRHWGTSARWAREALEGKGTVEFLGSLTAFFLLMACFAELIEQGWGFMQEVLWLVTIAEACCVVVLDAWATTCHVIIF